MRHVGRAVWAFASYDGGLPLALLCVLLGAVASHVAWNRWP
jgi:hypothetical protein